MRIRIKDWICAPETAVPIMAFVLIFSSCVHAANSGRQAVDPAQMGLHGKIIDYGIYEVVRAGGLVDRPETTTGLAHARATVRLRETTRRIPLRKGQYFAFYSRMEPFGDRRAVELRKVVRHPEMVLPDGSRKQGYEMIERKRVRSGTVFTLTGYVFDEEYEMVEGEWRFQYWHGDRLLVEQTFETYRPGVNRAERE